MQTRGDAPQGDPFLSAVDGVLRSGRRHERGAAGSHRGLTPASLKEALERHEEALEEERRASLERYESFISTIPEGLRDDDDVLYAAMHITNGIPMHPKDAERLNARITEKIEAHERALRGEHPSGLWVPPHTLLP